ncbi:hypothetical protein Kpol_2000p32 [Vanderwaltozyma polyspora DSM 70294]|uniref:Diphthamide biosynthesis protein 4 n=1 Tax=Vanderwaltozyma polyspora (strain ATCC 22028 / DSM 70294 / BCRC 21397 / CBS 2163 / NBRC 10782 / NRRL Y-8283 / UCD 57-17) TaxID=436907 RepID=A7TF42_VANPO|nr:uncharacterized protein Kpol_2000p32 [Vanderwaltozyma polyspora DSM 70294]EDO19067.1 hypothetical protein Kpol_2000p32 [Vanderwaltozyma polyspora DSM 70294]
MTSKTDSVTHYMVLGVDLDSSLEDVKKAYKERLLTSHPDKTGIEANIMPSTDINRIKEAYKVLSNPVLRAEYNNMLEKSNNLQGFHNCGDGLDEYSLDEFIFNPVNYHYTLDCPRCKAKEGFQLTEETLEEHVTENDATQTGFQLLVQCSSCSQWLKVHFDVGDAYE